MRATALSLLATFITTTAFAFQNEPDGFRGIKWGTEISEVSDQFALNSDERSMATYTRRDDKLAIGDAELIRLTYQFYKGRLHSVSMNTQEYANRRALQIALRTQFGQGSQPNRYMERYYWSGVTTIIALNCNTSAETCHLLFWSTEASKQKSADEKEAGQKAKRDF